MHPIFIFICLTGVAVCLACAFSPAPLFANKSNNKITQKKTPTKKRSKRIPELITDKQIEFIMGRIDKLLAMRWTEKTLDVYEFGMGRPSSNCSYNGKPYDSSVGYFSMWKLITNKLDELGVDYTFTRTSGGTPKGRSYNSPQADCYNSEGGVCAFQVITMRRDASSDIKSRPSKPLHQLPLSEVTALDAITYKHPDICQKLLFDAAGIMVRPTHEWAIKRTDSDYNYSKGAVVFDMSFEAIADQYVKRNPGVKFKNADW